MNTSELISREIRAHMARNSLTAGDLAAALGLSSAAISRRLTGQVEWSVGELSRACERMGISMADLIPAPVAS